jgi:phosphoribosylaminoimidazole-succinocarboxamide synthase
MIAAGKVRNTHSLPGHPKNRLVQATNRISIFDHALKALVAQKGEILTAMNVFWKTGPLAEICRHDIVAFGSGIDEFLPADLRGNVGLQKTAIVAQTLNMLDVEAVVRLCLTGSGWDAYQDDGIVCGHQLPAGLQNGSELPYPIFTPTTKAVIGHDEHVTADSVAKKYGAMPERLALQLAMAGSRHARSCGIVLADTKFEFGRDENDDLVLGDERLTPDSSRFWSYLAWLSAQEKGEIPPAFDKEFVRIWGKTLGINKRKPEIDSDVDWVHAQTVPEDILRQTTLLYRYIFWRLTEMKLETFQRDKMEIAMELPPLNIQVVLGSRTDLEQARAGIQWLQSQSHITSSVNIISCHRNPEELRNFADSAAARNADVVIAGAGKAAQLPGVLKSWLVHFGNLTPVIGVAFQGKDDTDEFAARLSITEITGQPVELNSDGHAYCGSEGMEEACRAAVKHEFLPKYIKQKPAELNIMNF